MNKVVSFVLGVILICVGVILFMDGFIDTTASKTKDIDTKATVTIKGENGQRISDYDIEIVP